MTPTPPTHTPSPCVILGVTGSIAAYKAADLTSKLVQEGLETVVVMTANAAKLVQPQTFLTLSQHPVITDLWDVPDWRPEHIALADRANLLVVAPATANFIAKYAHGIADDALSTVALSYEGPVIVAPAMNPRMWRHPATQANVTALRERGVYVVGPNRGRVACSGDGDPGRLAEVGQIRNAVLATLATARFSRRKPLRILLTAGPTREAVDPVRFLSNRSSGKMGYALAEAAAALGHKVTLVSGPVNVLPPAAAKTIGVNTAAEMAAAVTDHFDACDVLIMAAAVADYRPLNASKQKLKKGEAGLTLQLERTDDILASVAKIRTAQQIVVGFAAETENLETAARDKLARKNLDWIVANDIGRQDIGFESDQNQVTIYAADGTATALEKMSKLQTAAAILERVLPAQP